MASVAARTAGCACSSNCLSIRAASAPKLVGVRVRVRARARVKVRVRVRVRVMVRVVCIGGTPAASTCAPGCRITSCSGPALKRDGPTRAPKAERGIGPQ